MDEFSFIHERVPFVFHSRNGHLLSAYPIGAALLAIPFYVISALGTVPLNSPFLSDLEKLSSTVILALSGLILYLTLLSLVSRRIAFVFLMVYGFGTSSFSVTSQALWQHTAGQLAIASSLYCLVKGPKNPAWIKWAGFSLSFAIISRPTNLIVGIVFGVYVFLYHRRQVVPFLIGGLPPLLFQLWYNAVYFDSPFWSQFSLIGGNLWQTPLPVGLAGVLLSPSRGLLICSPIFILSFLGIALSWFKNHNALLGFAGTGCLLIILLYGKFSMWWGGGSYGPRLLSDLNPILTLCLYPIASLLASRIIWK